MFASCGLRFCLGGLLVLLLGLLACPSLGSGGVSAMENTTAVASTNVIVNAAASVAVSVDSSVVMDAFSAGWKNELVMGSASLKVRTNNEAGYSMYIATTDNTTSMVNYANLDGGEITALTSDKLSSEFEGNSWGYSLMEGTVSPDASTTRYSGISKDMTMIANPSTKTEEDSYTLAFAAQIDQSLSSGQYMNSVMISVVANPATINDLNDLIYMQDMTPEICKNTKAKNGASTVTPGNEVTKQLIDIRDGKKYWVAKLADNNCWMTQNLALDLDPNRPLTPETSDVKTDYVAASATENQLPEKTTANNAGTRSWNYASMYVLINPANPSSDCNVISSASALINCTVLKNVSGWSDDFVAHDVTSGGTTTYTAIGKDAQGNDAYDAHYLLGNHYQWRAVTVERADDLSNSATTPAVHAEESICPKNWRLALSGDSAYVQGGSYGVKGSYAYLARQYGLVTSDTAGSLASGNYDVAKAPLYVVRSGSSNEGSGALTAAGRSGYYWTGTVGNTTQSYYFEISGTTLLPAVRTNGRYFGLTVRCVAR